MKCSKTVGPLAVQVCAWYSLEWWHYARPANSHGLAVSLTDFSSFDSLTDVVTVFHGFVLVPRFYFQMDSCKSLLQGRRTGSIMFSVK